MNKLNRNLRFLPIVGITLTIIGYLLLTYQTFNLSKRKTTLLNEIKELENSKTRLTVEAKVKDTIISIQEVIIAQSSDSSTVKKGIELDKTFKEPISDHFTITKKENYNVELAKKFEKDGFKFLLRKDVIEAIKYFKKSENSYNGFHNVYEIANYLEKNKSRLLTNDELIWKETYTTLLEEYSWKMPEDIKSNFTKIIN